MFCAEGDGCLSCDCHVTCVVGGDAGVCGVCQQWHPYPRGDWESAGCNESHHWVPGGGRSSRDQRGGWGKPPYKCLAWQTTCNMQAYIHSNIDCFCSNYAILPRCSFTTHKAVVHLNICHLHVHTFDLFGKFHTILVHSITIWHCMIVVS